MTTTHQLATRLNIPLRTIQGWARRLGIAPVTPRLYYFTDKQEQAIRAALETKSNIHRIKIQF
jgi:hypothetical protein